MDALRRLFARPRLVGFTALVLRARCVRPSLGFALRELARVRATRVYRLRAGGLRVALRHRSADAVTLGEVFHEHDYEPVGEVRARLQEVQTIVDLGANVGLFGAFAAARWPTSTITAFEPDPDNCEVHRRTIALNRLGPRWQLVEAAAGATEGTLRFAGGQASLSHIAGDADLATMEVPVRDVLDELAAADLVKIDIEGGEWAILGDPRFRARPPRVLVLEYHPHLAPTLPAREAAESALVAAGMRVDHLKPGPGGHGMLWAWRP